jgi:amino acid transporter
VIKYRINPYLFSFIGSTLGLYSIGLFQTCSNSQCIKNQYGNINSESSSPPKFSTRLFNAGPLSIVGVFIQLIVCVLCFLTAFIYLPPKPSVTCYLTPFIIIVAFLFQFLTITEASYGIHLNGRSSSVFEAALFLQVIIIILTIIAADRIHEICDIQYV